MPHILGCWNAEDTEGLRELEKFSLLETMHRPRRSHASDAGSIHSTELDFRDVESNGGGLQPGLHHFQRTGQNSSHCAATSRAKLNRSGDERGQKIKRKLEERARGWGVAQTR